MEQLDTANLPNLPREIQCMIFKGPMTLQDFLSFQQVSQIEDILFSCIEELISKGDEETLSLDTVLSMERIRAISPEYPIIIDDQNKVADLAEHPTLREAVFDLTDLKGGQILPDIATLFFSKYRTFGNKCQDCQERYNLTFFIQDNDFRLIQVTEGSLKMYNLLDITRDSLHKLYTILNKKVPICEYTGDLNNHLYDLNIFPCLTRINLRYDPNFVDIDEPENNYEYILIENTKEYYLSWPKKLSVDVDIDYRRKAAYFIQGLLDYFDDNRYVYPQVTTFFPIVYRTYRDVDVLKEIFPNLTSIWLIAEYLPPYEVDADFSDYNEIVIVNQLPTPFDRNYYLQLFKPEDRGKIIFSESDWLY